MSFQVLIFRGIVAAFVAGAAIRFGFTYAILCGLAVETVLQVIINE
jgi:hypothetical protein